MNRIKQRKKASPEEQKSFLKTALHRNRYTMTAMSVLGVTAELYNIFRVLFLSKSGLQSVNNQIYFGFYCFMLVLSGLYLVLQGCLKNREEWLYRVQVTVASAALLWNTLLSVYDARSAESVDGLVMVVFMLCFAALFLLKPSCSLPSIIGSTILFCLLTWPYQSAGMILNLTIAAAIGCIISFMQFWHMWVGLYQNRRLTDIEERLRSEREKFWLSQEQYELIVNQTNDILFKWSIAEDNIEFSQNWNDIFGYPLHIKNFAQEISSGETIDPKLKHTLMRIMQRVRDGVPYQEKEVLIHGRQGNEKWYHLRVLTQFTEDGHPILGIGMLSDVMVHKQTIAQLEYAVQRDPLTGVLNKAAIEKHINHRLSGDSGAGTALMVVDLDDFKNINDTYGHPCGDYVLTACTRCMQDVFSSETRFGRIGGDEFIIFTRLPREETLKKVEQLIEGVKNLQWKGTPLNISCSVGITLVSDGADYARLYYEADDALYTAKRLGKGRYCLYSAGEIREEAPGRAKQLNKV